MDRDEKRAVYSVTSGISPIWGKHESAQLRYLAVRMSTSEAGAERPDLTHARECCPAVAPREAPTNYVR